MEEDTDQSPTKSLTAITVGEITKSASDLDLGLDDKMGTHLNIGLSRSKSTHASTSGIIFLNEYQEANAIQS